MKVSLCRKLSVTFWRTVFSSLVCVTLSVKHMFMKVLCHLPLLKMSVSFSRRKLIPTRLIRSPNYLDGNSTICPSCAACPFYVVILSTQITPGKSPNPKQKPKERPSLNPWNGTLQDESIEKRLERGKQASPTRKTEEKDGKRTARRRRKRKITLLLSQS